MRRSLVYFLVIATLFGQFFVSPTYAISDGVIISEVLYDPSGSDYGLEWIELYNSSDLDIDISGWKIQKAGTYFQDTFAFPSGSYIGSHDFLVVAGNAVVGDVDYTVPDLGLQNGGSSTDGVRLVDTTDSIIDTVLYDSPNSNSIPGEFSGEEVYAVDTPSGTSLCRTKLVDTDDYASDFVACPNTTLGSDNILPKGPVATITAPSRAFAGQAVIIQGAGSLPGDSKIISWLWEIENDTYTEPNPVHTFNKGEYTINLSVTDEYGLTNQSQKQIKIVDFNIQDYLGLKITELFPAPKELDINKNGEVDSNDEFIEITNTSNHKILLSGLFLADKSSLEDPAFILPDINLKPHETILIFRDTSNISLNNSDDAIYLVGPEQQIIDSFTYSSSKPDLSWNLGSQGTYLSKPTPGQFDPNSQRLLANTGQRNPLFASFLNLKKYDKLRSLILIKVKASWHQDRKRVKEITQNLNLLRRALQKLLLNRRHQN